MAKEYIELRPEGYYLAGGQPILFLTGFTRSASAILENLHFIKQVGCETQAAFEQGDLRRFAELLQVHWQYKKKRSAGMSNPAIDGYYELALRNRALGGKCDWRRRLRRIMCSAGLREVRVRFDFQGTTVVAQS